MNTKELLDRIFERLKEENCLKDFKLKRSESEFIRSKNSGFDQIGLGVYISCFGENCSSGKLYIDKIINNGAG